MHITFLCRDTESGIHSEWIWLADLADYQTELSFRFPSFIHMKR